MKFNPIPRLTLNPIPKHLCLPLMLIMANLAFSQGLSKKCVDELLAVPEKKKDFNLQGFLTKDLPAEVVKVKAQLKLPFGKPKDDKVTDIGVTVGCLKGFPENPGQIQAMLKDVGLEMAKRTATNKMGADASKAGASESALKSGASTSKKGANFNISNLTSNFGAITPSSSSAASANPVLKECDAIFNPKNRFCYDGEIYDLCDEMRYNPTTHICSGYIARRALCNGAQYNPLTQICENNYILSSCGEATYNPETHGCKDSSLFEYPQCGEIAYKSETHGCHNNTVLPKCGAYLYYTETHGCHNNAVLPKCGAYLYNSETHGCSNNSVFPKCGVTLYNPTTHNCRNGTVLIIPNKDDEYEEEIAYAKTNASDQVADIEEETERETRFGIRANIGMAILDGSGIGLGAGMFLLIPFSSIYFVPGMSFDIRQPSIEYGKINETSIEIPLFLRFRYREENIVYLGFGPLFDFVLSSSASYDYSNYYYSRSSLDFGIATELGFRLNDHFSIDLRYLYNFANYKHKHASSSSSSYIYSDSESGLIQFKIGMNILF